MAVIERFLWSIQRIKNWYAKIRMGNGKSETFKIRSDLGRMTHYFRNFLIGMGYTKSRANTEERLFYRYTKTMLSNIQKAEIFEAFKRIKTKRRKFTGWMLVLKKKNSTVIVPVRWKSSIDDAVDKDPGVVIPAAPESAGLWPVSSLVEGTRRYLAISIFTGTCMPLSWDLLSETDVEAFSHL